MIWSIEQFRTQRHEDQLRNLQVDARRRLDPDSDVTSLCCRQCPNAARATSHALRCLHENVVDEGVMRILSHRGFWREPGERNSISAFARSVIHGFGLETDIRDHNGQLVISHDVPLGKEVGLDELLQLFQNRNLPLALNIKADGLADLVSKALSTYNIGDWFVFDMSIPDMRNCIDKQIPVFARVSEVEKDPPWIEEVAGIWFDSFGGDKYDVGRIAGYLREGKQVCIVSPELHQRQCQAVWRDIKALSDQTGLMICTDYPEQAREFFMNGRRDC